MDIDDVDTLPILPDGVAYSKDLRIKNAWRELVSALGIKGHPVKLVDYEQLLHPRFEEKWQTIPAKIWEWAQVEAKVRMMTMSGNTETTKHLRRILMGEVPFGLNVEDEDNE